MASGRPDYTALTLMMGNNAGVLRNVALDAAGNILTLIKGQFGGAPVTIAVDAGGNILGILQGDYGGVLHTVALDSGGRIVVGQALVASQQIVSSQNCPMAVETVLVSVLGSGVCDCCSFLVHAAVNSQNGVFRVYCDGVQAFTAAGHTLYDLGLTPSTPGVSLLRYTVNDVIAVLLTKVFEFKVSFELRYFSSMATDHVVDGRAWYSMIT